MAGFTRRVELWDVLIRECEVPPRWRVPETRVRRRGPKRFAMRRAIECAAADAGVPPWKPLYRHIVGYTSATLHVEEVKLG